MNRDVDDERLRRYLLGELPEEESAALEEQYFGADDVFAMRNFTPRNSMNAKLNTSMAAFTARLSKNWAKPVKAIAQ